MKKNRKKRNEFVDFSKHNHRVEIFNSETNEIRIDHFQINNSRMEYIQFINTDNNLFVSGDYGNWVFSRPFIPSKDGYVCDHYWLEKLKIGSYQSPYKYDPDGTAEEIRELIKHGLEEYGFEGERLKTIKEWFSDLLDYVDDELSYTYHAYRGYDAPDIDLELVPMCKDLSAQLLIIFDAFDEICDRLDIEPVEDTN